MYTYVCTSNKSRTFVTPDVPTPIITLTPYTDAEHMPLEKPSVPLTVRLRSTHAPI